MRILFTGALFFLLVHHSTAQTTEKHSFGLAIESHHFADETSKFESQVKYLFQPHKSFTLVSSLGYGNFGDMLQNDGYFRLHQTFSVSEDLQIKPFYNLIEQKSFQFDPFVSIGGGIGFFDKSANSSTDRTYTFMNFGLGSYYHLKNYSSVFISFQAQSNQVSNTSSQFLQAGGVYRFHQKKEKANNKEYDRLSEQFMNANQKKETLESQKIQVIEDKEMMETSYNQMLELSRLRVEGLEDSLGYAKLKARLILESNFELKVELEALKKDMVSLEKMKLGSKKLADYTFVKSLGSPFLVSTPRNGHQYALRSSYDMVELQESAKSYLMDYEEVYVVSDEQGLYLLVVNLDVDDEELYYEIHHLSDYFPLLFQLMGKP
jgi:hypothetical protein